MAPAGVPTPFIPQSVLFLCGMNAIRSPMAEVLARHMLAPGVFLASAGLRAGERDPFVDVVLEEQGLTLGERRPQTLEDLADTNFDLIVTLSPQAHHRALELTRSMAVEVEYWPMPDPTNVNGSREQILNAYRDVRQRLTDNIAARWGLVEQIK